MIGLLYTSFERVQALVSCKFIQRSSTELALEGVGYGSRDPDMDRLPEGAKPEWLFPSANLLLKISTEGPPLLLPKGVAC